MDTVRNELPFYASLAAVVAEVQKRFLYGKGYERICKGWERLKKGLQPAAIGTVCTTRFAHSERKVYKAFFRNLVVFIQDLKSPDRASETGIAAEIAKVSSVVFIVQLMGIIYLLQCVKNLSLLLQTVNQLPWELKDAIKEHCDLMESLAADLKAGKWGRTLPGTAHSDGKRTPALEFLSKHLPEVKQLKLSLYDPRDDEKLDTISLVVSSSQRGSRTSNPAFDKAAGGSDAPPDATSDISAALKQLEKMASLIATTLWKRLDPPHEFRVLLLDVCLLGFSEDGV